MALFQKSVLKKYINDLNKETLQAAWQQFQSHFHNAAIQQNILNAKEEEYQEGFVRDLFVNILGYTLKPQPDYNLVMEQKSTSDATKSDGAVLKAGFVTTVIELKDTNTTDLNKVEKQAFGYKHQHKDCIYVITSNFEKLRLYINDAIDYEEFDLFRLSKEQFALMYCCLQQQALHNDVPLTMKQQSLAAEENITKKLYADYSRFKKQLFTDITEQNPQYNKLELFKKTQKLLDRFLFILFAEDRLLLPPNSVREILQQWEHLKELDNYVPLYDRFKKYFGYLNTGYQGKNYEIFAYNGGLFAADELLDNITVDDQLLYDSCKGLSNYDFESEVDVNILGHIFEHSLGEIEEVERELNTAVILSDSEGSADKSPTDPALGRDDRKTSKRKKDGVFYTPRYITKYIVENTLGTLCTQKKEELNIIDEAFTPQKRKANTQQLLQKLEGYRQWLLQLTICDPACGSGAFLNQALEFLIAEHRSLDELKAKLFGDTIMLSDVEASILENNLYGVDINDEATEIAKLSLWLRTARKGRKLNNLNQHIKCGNSLIDDPAIAGDKAFNWEQEFPQVFAKGGFDVVIGNPPYVRAELLFDIKEFLQNTYKTFQTSADLFSFFYEKAFHILKQNGLFGFISNAFDKTNAAIELRKWLKQNTTLKSYIDFTEVQIFEGATTYPVIIISKNLLPKNSEFDYIKIKKQNIRDINLYQPSIINQNDLNKENWVFHDNSTCVLIEKLKVHPVVTKKYKKCYYGIKTSLNEAFLIPKNFLPNESIIKPIYEGKELSKWVNVDPIQDLILFKSKWTKAKFDEGDEDIVIEKVKEVYPQVIEHLLQFKEKAKKRFDKGDYWWELRNCAYYDLFEQPKIIFPNLQNSNKFSFDNSGVYINAPAVMVSLTHLNNPIQEGKFLLTILNSKVIWLFLKSICVVRSGGYIEVKPQYFEQLPIPSINEESQLPFIAKADIMLSKNKELQQLKQQLLQLLQGKYEGLTLSKKLQDWPTLSFKDFLKELDKQKIKLSLPEQSEWMQYFEAEKAKANAIQQLINTTDAAIDEMVYALYELTEEEIAIVKAG